MTDPQAALGDPLSRNLTTDTSVLSAAKFEQRGRGADTHEAVVFESSGTSGNPKQVPYAYSQLPAQRRHEAKAFELAGLTSDDVVLTLGAPLPSISGWASRSGSRELGASVLNRSFDDYKQVIEWREAESVTALFATPLVARSIGEEICQEYGRPRDVFPNLRLGFMFGDFLPTALRADLSQQWGFNSLRSLYGSVEADVLAIAVDETQELVPLIDKLVFEILPDDHSNPEPTDIRDITEETTGSLLVSDPTRDQFSFTRYKIGDIVRVTPGSVPRIRLMGREDDTINLGGAPLYERQIQQAMRDTYKQALTDWRAVVSRPDQYPAIDFYVVSEETAGQPESDFRARLFECSPPVKEAYQDIGEGVIDYLRVHEVSSLEQVLTHVDFQEYDRDIKAARIVFDDSYSTSGL